ncbi:MAG: metallophosphoesterase [Pirellulales bacterium]
MLRATRPTLRFEHLEPRIVLAGLPQECRLADVDDNGVVDRADVAVVVDRFGGAGGRYSQGDTDGNAIVNLRDLMVVQAHLGRNCDEPTIRFAAFGDYGQDGPDEAAAAELVKSWNVDFVVTLGDNNYGIGAAETIDANVGKHYREFIGNYAGAYGDGSPTNRFFPSLGNHDWWFADIESIAPYLDYFDLPGEGFSSSSGNERYYDFVWGHVHFFALDSNQRDPDGRTFDSVQGQWLREQLAASTAAWQVVYFHESPYSSGSDSGSTPAMQWPFDEWGADLVLSAHDHNYERLSIDGLTYLVAGTGGAALRVMSPLVPGSIVTYNEAHGALLITANGSSLRAEFHSVTNDDTLIDCIALGNTTCAASGAAVNEVAPAAVVRGVETAHAEARRARVGPLAAKRDELRAVDETPRAIESNLLARRASRDTARRSVRTFGRSGESCVDATIANFDPRDRTHRSSQSFLAR